MGQLHAVAMDEGGSQRSIAAIQVLNTALRRV